MRLYTAPSLRFAPPAQCQIVAFLDLSARVLGIGRSWGVRLSSGCGVIEVFPGKNNLKPGVSVGTNVFVLLVALICEHMPQCDAVRFTVQFVLCQVCTWMILLDGDNRGGS